jgi:glycosyltransferase involved in cell wall biosynthesis
VSSADVGCLLSRAEAGGMVLREYHALGLVVMGTTVGGAPEHMFPDVGRAFAPAALPADIAAWLVDLVRRPSELARLRERAWACRERATWDVSVRRWQAFWPPVNGLRAETAEPDKR